MGVTTGVAGKASRQGPRRAVVLTGGDPVAPELARSLPGGAYVVAADSGLEQASRLGLHVDLAVGDFDSVPPEVLADAERAGCRLERHGVAKDHTDLELALVAARAWRAEHVVVVGGHGGRLDHLLANALVLGGASTLGMEVEALMGAAHVAVIRPGPAHLVGGVIGELVTLLAVGGAALGVRTDGLRYPLVDEDLDPGSTRGVSNEILAEGANVALSSGTLLVVRPRALTGSATPGRPCAPGR